VLDEGYRDELCARYKIQTDDIHDNDDDTAGCVKGFEILERIGSKRGFKIKGGEIDTERTSIMVLDEFRGGKIGRFSLEKPNDHKG
jgi:ribosome biogenesis GTPase A